MADFILEDIEIEEDQEYILTDPKLYYDRAFVLFDTHHYEDALKEVENAVKYGNGEIEFNVLKLKILMALENFQECEQFYSKSNLLSQIYNSDVPENTKKVILTNYAICIHNLYDAESIQENHLILGLIRVTTELASLFRYGKGVPKDESFAIALYRIAAEKGNTDAQASLGYMFQNGCGTNKNLIEAASWYKKAAEQGDMTSQYNLALMLFEGQVYISKSLL